MASQEINIRLSLKDDLSVNLKGVTKTLENVGVAGQNSGKRTQESFKGVISQAKSMITPFRQVSFVIGATLGAAAAAVMNVSANLDQLDSAASKTGVSSEELSRKLYGFNIASQSMREGISATKGALQSMQTAFVGVGGAVGWVIGKIDYAAKYWGAQIASMQTGVKPGDIMSEMASQKPVTNESITLAANTSEEIKKLSLSERKFKEYQLEQTVAAYRKAGMSEVLIADYANAQKITLEVEKNNEINKNAASRLKIEGQTTKAFQIEQNIQLSNYVKVWGQDGEAMQSFRKLQQAQLKEFQFNASGMGQVMKQVGSAMTTSLGAAFVDAIKGFKNMKEVARDFGNTLISIIMTAIARLILMKTIGAALAPMTGGASLMMFHQGGVVRKAHSGMRMGNDEVPIIAQAGEGIISRKGMRSLGAENFNRVNRGEGTGGGQQVIVHMPIQAWDSQDVYRNRKTLSAGIIEELRRNGDFRGAVRQYR